MFDQAGIDLLSWRVSTELSAPRFQLVSDRDHSVVGELKSVFFGQRNGCCSLTVIPMFEPPPLFRMAMLNFGDSFPWEQYSSDLLVLEAMARCVSTSLITPHSWESGLPISV